MLRLALTNANNSASVMEQVDLCRPGHMTACLRNFQETIKSNDDNWDAYFGALHTACGAFFALSNCKYNTLTELVCLQAMHGRRRTW